MSTPLFSGETFLPSRAHEIHLADDAAGEDDGCVEAGGEDDQSRISDAAGHHDNDSEMQWVWHTCTGVLYSSIQFRVDTLQEASVCLSE